MILECKDSEAESEDKTEAERISPVPCLLRASDGKPVLAFVDSFDGEHAAIKPTDRDYKKPLWFTRQSIFQAQEGLIRALRRAYEAGRVDDLRSLWRKAERWMPTSESEAGLLGQKGLF